MKNFNNNYKPLAMRINIVNKPTVGFNKATILGATNLGFNNYTSYKRRSYSNKVNNR